MRAIVNNAFEQNRKSWSRIGLKITHQFADMFNQRDIPQPLTGQISVVFAGIGKPTVKHRPLLLRGFLSQNRLQCLIKYQLGLEGMRLGEAILDASAAHVRVESHSLMRSSAIRVLLRKSAA